MNTLNNAIILFLMSLLFLLSRITTFLVTRLAAFTSLLARGMKWLSGRVA